MLDGIWCCENENEDENEKLTKRVVALSAGTVVIQGVKIGRWAMVGAGSVVTKDIPDGWLVVGNRCKLIKEINQDMLQQKQKADAHHRNSDH